MRVIEHRPSIARRRRRAVGVLWLATLIALASGRQRFVSAGDAPGSLVVESDPAGAAVYVDGRFAGESPLTVASIAAGVHRVHLVRDGYLEHSRLLTVKKGARATVHAQLTAAAPALKIVVLEGEGAVNIIQQKTAVAPVIEVRDRNDQPVAGAIVRFAIQRGRASFDGARTLTVTTNAAGRATATGLTATGRGALQIAASAAFQGQTAAVSIAQTAVMTAAEASSIASGTAASAGGGGGLSNLAIAGIVAGAGAGIGGALIASKASSESDSDKCRASAACGQWDVLFTSPGLNVSACSTAVVGGFCCQGFNIDLSGAFHEVWSSSTPVVQVDGTLTPTGLTGVLRCLSTPATGTISAAPSGQDYLGTATLSGATVSMRVVKVPKS